MHELSPFEQVHSNLTKWLISWKQIWNQFITFLSDYAAFQLNSSFSFASYNKIWLNCLWCSESPIIQEQSKNAFEKNMLYYFVTLTSFYELICIDVTVFNKLILIMNFSMLECLRLFLCPSTHLCWGLEASSLKTVSHKIILHYNRLFQGT